MVNHTIHTPNCRDLMTDFDEVHTFTHDVEGNSQGNN